MGLALWLAPSDPSTSSDLGGLIDDLAKRHDCPRFGPHVTLLSGLPTSSPLPPILARLEQAIQSWRTASHTAPLELRFTRLGSKAEQGVFFQYLFAHIRDDEPLLSLRRAVREALLPEEAAAKADDYMPHLSLAYGVDTPDRQAAFLMRSLVDEREVRVLEQTVGQGEERCEIRGHDGMDVSEVQIWRCEGRPEEWALVASVPL
ncbi:uncharacterized protein JCM10292_000562 [Rhodotorula paludigena]|uniref:uncharacterized protein n=1 Tax=Rhodotorula paludigena TaxID=86838 RepID=UPI0031740C4C